MIDYETAKELFDYDPDTGMLTWKVRPSVRSSARIGDVAWTLNNNGYRRVMFRGKSYLAHRIVWLLTHGNWPEKDIDHLQAIAEDLYSKSAGEKHD